MHHILCQLLAIITLSFLHSCQNFLVKCFELKSRDLTTFYDLTKTKVFVHFVPIYQGGGEHFQGFVDLYIQLVTIRECYMILFYLLQTPLYPLRSIMIFWWLAQPSPYVFFTITFESILTHFTTKQQWIDQEKSENFKVVFFIPDMSNTAAKLCDSVMKTYGFLWCFHDTFNSPPWPPFPFPI